MRKKLSRGDKFAKFREFTFVIFFVAFVIFRENKLSRFSCNRIIKCSDTVFLAEKRYQRGEMGINFRELKTTIFRENKLSRILENRIFCGIKLSRICQNSRKSRKFLPHYFLPLKYMTRLIPSLLYNIRKFIAQSYPSSILNWLHAVFVAGVHLFSLLDLKVQLFLEGGV